jgi:hypothetical protein
MQPASVWNTSRANAPRRSTERSTELAEQETSHGGCLFHGYGRRMPAAQVPESVFEP